MLKIIMQKITISLRVPEKEGELIRKAAEKSGIAPDRIKTLNIIKKSIDARDKRDVKIVYSLEVSERIEPIKEIAFLTARRAPANPPIVVGSGPAGLFAGLCLAEAGLKPIICERGESVEQRRLSVDRFSSGGKLNCESNIQFGEGGAGTFSDGKLNTGIGGETVPRVLAILKKYGAPEEITYLNKPHIGTDKLIDVVRNIRNRIIALGGQVKFLSKVSDIDISGGKIRSVTVNGEVIPADTVILAVGHSARDTFEMLYNKGILMERKEFACGLRIEHKRILIDRSQYGDCSKYLPAADYKLVSHTPIRPVYTFCMCPGGYVMPAASEEGGVVTNGMSLYKRDNVNSNSALLVNVLEKDLSSSHPLAGMYYQREIERSAFRLGGDNYAAPVQRSADFLIGKVGGIGIVSPSYLPGVKPANLTGIYNRDITESIKFAIKDMGRRLSGFDSPDAILTGAETRSSSPVRILRGDDYVSISVKGLYPAGEGAGYAGGITSAAADGIKIAEKIIGALNALD